VTSGNGNSGTTANTNNSSGSSRAVRVIPFKFKGLSRISDNPAELKRITDEGRCVGCREKGYNNSQDPKCVFCSPRSAFKFSDVYKETSIADYEAGKNKPRGGNTYNNAMQLAAVYDHDDHHPLPMAEDHMIEDGH
jgi:Fe-S-cluster-containing dehydrogenase component